MEKVQRFCLIGTTVVEQIPCEHVDGHAVILWEDIERAFGVVRHVKCNGVIVNLLKGPNLKR